MSVPGLLREGFETLWHRPAKQVAALDGLRAAAVLLVMLTHFRDAWRDVGNAPHRALQLPMFEWGWTGVDLFFVLSGFLIGGQLWRELKRTGGIKVGRFILRRGLRIWPLYYAMLGLIALSAGGTFGFADFTFLSNYLPTNYMRGWTLSTEEQFYIVMPLVLLLVPRMPHGLARGAWLLAVLFALQIGVRFLTSRSLLAQGVPEELAAKEMLHPFHLHSEALLAGMLIAFASVMWPWWQARAAGKGGAFSLAGFAIAVGATGLALVLRDVDRLVFSTLALALIFGSVTNWLLWDRSWVTAPARSRYLYPVSRLSYGMYLNHYAVLPMVTTEALALFRGWGLTDDAQFAGGLVVMVATSIAVAVLTFVLIEHPFLHLRDTWFSATRRPSGGEG